MYGQTNANGANNSNVQPKVIFSSAEVYKASGW